ncbi:MAG: glycosyltransferase family 9 protein [Bacteroidetes bacterium]|nr:glycosyltransferase family 9 protein [Bacteroidota bacterium]
MVSLLKNNNRILIIRLSSLGDILLTTPLIRSIKKKFPQITVDFLLKKQYQDALKYNKYISNLYLFQIGKDEKQKLNTELRFNNYDIVIDLQNNLRSRKITRVLKRPIVKFNKHNINKFLLVQFKLNKLKSLPQIPVRYTQTIPNFSLDDEGLNLYIPENIKTKLTDDKKYIGFGSGSKHFTKMWPIDYYIQLGEELNNNGFEIVLFGGKSDKQICKQLKDNLPFAINLCNDNDLLQTAKDMKQCLVLVCNDSGLMHTACSVGVPVLTFFGSTVKEFGFAPYKNKNLILENNSLTCRPCSHIGRNKCPKKHFNCMIKLSPEFAFNKLHKLLNDK